MCGIAGLILNTPAPIKRADIDAVQKRLEHRGPDDRGVLALSDDKVYLGTRLESDVVAKAVLVHTRLSILDLSKTGWQPMASADGRYYIVFNGEIYNYVELREDLIKLGHRFVSRSDTEVLLAAYAQWGSNALARLTGMFAFAILDRQARKVFLARDFFGIKPLYYAHTRAGFAFASEIPALLDLSGAGRQVNPQRMYEYLRFGITDHGGETLFAEIKQLPAAHCMEIALDTPLEARPARYWQLAMQERTDLSFNDAAERLRETFLENIKLHLRSDVPLGAALSGGIDSSAIVMGMRRLNPSLEIHAFSYIAAGSPLNEERWIDTIGRSAGIKIHKVIADAGELQTDLANLVAMQGEPFGSSSIYAQWRVFQRAHEEGIKVMLDGQGADEMLAGYHYYIAARIASLLRQGQWYQAVRLVSKAAKTTGLGIAWMWLRAAEYLMPSSLQRYLRPLIKKDLVPAWLNWQWFEDRGVQPRSLGYTTNRQVLKQSLHDSVTANGLDHLLRYEDRNSMAFSIESRVPFLTPSLANFVFSLPEDYMIAPDGTTKAVFRQAMRGIVPDAILDRKDKIGFATPEQSWLATLQPWIERLLTSDAANQMQVIDFALARQEWRRTVQGSMAFNWRIWRWINTILWAEKFAVRFA